MSRKSRTLYVSYGLLAFLVTSSSVTIAMDWSPEEVPPKETHSRRFRDQDYPQNNPKELKISSQIREKVDQILAKFKRDMEAYYRRTRGPRATGKSEAPAKPKQTPTTSNDSRPQKLLPEVALYINAISWKKKAEGGEPINIKFNAQDVVNAVQKSPGKYFGHSGLGFAQVFQAEFLKSPAGKGVINEIINQLNNQFIPDDKFNLSKFLGQPSNLEWKEWCIGFYVSWLFDQMQERKNIEEERQVALLKAEEEKRRKEAETKERQERERRQQEAHRVVSEQARKQAQERQEAEAKERQEQERRQQEALKQSAKEAEQQRLERERRKAFENLQKQQEEQNRKHQEEQRRRKEEAEKQEEQQQMAQPSVANIMKFGGMEINWVKAQPKMGIGISVPFSAEGVIEYAKKSQGYAMKFLASDNGKKLITGIINRLNGGLIPQDDFVSLDEKYTRAPGWMPSIANTDSNKTLIAQYANGLYQRFKQAKQQPSQAEQLKQEQQEEQLKQELTAKKVQAENEAAQEKDKRLRIAATLFDLARKYQYYYLEALKLLGIDPTMATQDVVNQDFRKKSRFFHSDKTSSPKDQVQFNTLKDAKDYAITYLNWPQAHKGAQVALQLLNQEALRDLRIKVPQPSLNPGMTAHFCTQMIEFLEAQARMTSNPSPQFLEKNQKLRNAYEAIRTYGNEQLILQKGW